MRTGRELDAYQAQVTLYRPAGQNRVTPFVDSLSVMTNEYLTGEVKPTSEFGLGREVHLDVPAYSQNLHRGEYPEFGGGGQVWCSPTSTTMVQYYWGEEFHVPDSELADIVAPNGDPQVDYAAIHAWDYEYEGAGNWPFNGAYAYSMGGIETFVTRLRSLAEAEKFIEAGIPVITSLAWDEEEMPEAGYGSNGHLMVLVGFTADGDPILNDPNHATNEEVTQVYTRENFEKVWQSSSKGTVYIHRAPGTPLPDNMDGVTANW